jgi:hypothetical protein
MIATVSHGLVIKLRQFLVRTSHELDLMGAASGTFGPKGFFDPQLHISDQEVTPPGNGTRPSAIDDQ